MHHAILRRVCAEGAQKTARKRRLRPDANKASLSAALMKTAKHVGVSSIVLSTQHAERANQRR